MEKHSKVFKLWVGNEEIEVSPFFVVRILRPANYIASVFLPLMEI